MNKNLWAKVKTGDTVIYADEYAGVFKAKILEVDIAVYAPERPAFREHPYGLTKDTGTVKIQYDSFELIISLEQLLKYSLERLQRLERAWSRYQTAKADAEFKLAAFKGAVSREAAF